MPEIGLGKTMEKPNFWRFAVHTRGEIYTVFDEESEFQVENSQFRQPGPKIWKNLILQYLLNKLGLGVRAVGSSRSFGSSGSSPALGA